MAALGSPANDFILAGAPATKFAVKEARGTKDVNFILNVIALGAEPLRLEAVLKQLGYAAIAAARNFQFEKTILNNKETMRIEGADGNSNGRPTSAWMCRKESMHARAPEARLRSQSRMSIRSKGQCRTANRIRQQCVSPGRTH